MNNKIYIVGIGPGHPDYILPIATRTILENKILVGSRRALETFAQDYHKVYPITADLPGLLIWIKEQLKENSVVVMVSGDPGYYSLLGYLKKNISEEYIKVIPGISSMSMAFSRINESWYDADLMSFHGREVPLEKLAYKKGRKVAFLTDAKNTAPHIAKILLDNGWDYDLKAYIANRLSYDDEEIVSGTLVEISQMKGYSHSVLVVLG